MIPEWEVEVSPGGPMIKLNGTVEEVRSELLRLNPDWDTHYPTNNTKESPSLNKRAFDSAGFFCFGRWNPCSSNRIREGIAYLRRVGGLPSRGPGPGNCARVSCSWSSAIWWCNDVSWFSISEILSYINKISKDPVGKTLQGGFGDIADGAAFLVDNCEWNQAPIVAGQAFATTNWNVVVRYDTDKCWKRHSR